MTPIALRDERKGHRDMKIDRVEFLTEYKLGAADERYTFQTKESTAMGTNLPVPEKPGAEVHILGDWVFIREVWKDKAHERACILVPRERVKKIIPYPDQAGEIFKALGD